MNKNKFKINLLRSQAESHKRFAKNYNFMAMSWSLYLLYKYEIQKNIPKKTKKLIDEIKEDEKILTSFKTSYFDILLEKQYIDSYQNLEYFIFDTLYSIYYNFPQFLKDKDSKINTNIEKIFQDNFDIEITRRNILEEKIQSKMRVNIIELINFIEKKFQLKIISLINKKALFIISQNRNIIIHNNGIINNQYIQNLNKEQIKSNYKLGQKIQINNKIQEDADCVIRETIKVIEKQIELNFEKIIKHGNALSL